MLSSIRCPSCQELIASAEDENAPTGLVQCPRCGQAVHLNGPVAEDVLSHSLTSEVSAEPQEEAICVVQDGAIDIRLPDIVLKSPNRLLRRIFVVLWLIVLFLLVGLSIPGYRFVRDRYNPWLTEENCKRIQPKMSLEEVEAIVSKGQPCRLEDVKAVVDPITNLRRQIVERNHGQTQVRPIDLAIARLPEHWQQWFRPFRQNDLANWEANWDALQAQADDLAWQAKRQKVACWYRWKRSDTRIFVGVSTENKVRLVFRITDSSDVRKARMSQVYAVYPFADMEIIERTGRSEKATLPEEKLVESYIHSKAADPDSIEINKWGPHDLKGELVTVPGYSLVGERRRKSVVKVRVRYWTKEADGTHQLNDMLYYLQNGEVFGSYGNPYGGTWIETLRGFETRLGLRR